MLYQPCFFGYRSCAAWGEEDLAKGVAGGRDLPGKQVEPPAPSHGLRPHEHGHLPWATGHAFVPHDCHIALQVLQTDPCLMCVLISQLPLGLAGRRILSYTPIITVAPWKWVWFNSSC